MTDAELLPCPFCGGAAKIYQDKHSDHGMWLIECSGCQLSLTRSLERDAIDAWNKRTSATVCRHYTTDELNAVCDCLISIMYPRLIYDADQLQMANTVINQTKVNAKTAWDILERNVIPADGNVVQD